MSSGNLCDGVKNDAQEGEHHGEQHPHVDQFHIVSLGQ